MKFDVAIKEIREANKEDGFQLKLSVGHILTAFRRAVVQNCTTIAEYIAEKP